MIIFDAIYKILHLEVLIIKLIYDSKIKDLINITFNIYFLNNCMLIVISSSLIIKCNIIVWQEGYSNHFIYTINNVSKKYLKSC